MQMMWGEVKVRYASMHSWIAIVKRVNRVGEEWPLTRSG